MKQKLAISYERALRRKRGREAAYPVLLRTWQVQRVAAVEDAIHSTLEARGVKSQAPGAEWFEPTLEEIEAIVKFVVA
jgi:T5orf172 domain